MPLLVSILPSDLARTRGGGERYAFELQRALVERLDGWSSLALVAASERADDLVPAGWSAVGSGRAGRLPSADAIGVRDALDAVPENADIVICHQWRTRATAALRLAQLRRPWKLVGIDYGGGSVPGYMLDRLPLPRADVGAHISYFEQRVSPVKARVHQVVRGGTDPAVFHPPDEERREYDFLMVGRFLPHKGQSLFLDALPSGARALLMGPSDTDDPAYLEAVKLRAADLDVEIRFDAPDEELVSAYQRCRFTAQVPVTPPGRNPTPPELLGLTMLEAMACGSVPLCPATGASADFVRDGDTGITYTEGSRDDLARALESARSSEERRLAMQAAAREEAARWTWPVAAGELLAALERVG